MSKEPEKPYLGQRCKYRMYPTDTPSECTITWVASPIVVNATVNREFGGSESHDYVNYWDGKGPQPTSRIVSEE